MGKVGLGEDYVPGAHVTAAVLIAEDEGISGEALGLPHLPDSEFQPPMELNAGEKWVKERIESRFPGRVLTIGRPAVLTRAI